MIGECGNKERMMLGLERGQWHLKGSDVSGSAGQITSVQDP